jgi:hypothetical protein
MNMHVTILGWLLIACGIMSAVGGTIVLFLGQIIFNRFPFPVLPEVPPGAPPFMAWMMSVIGISVIAVAAATTAAGIGLLQYRSWARIFAIIVAIFLLFNFPVGTAVAVYAFWVLFSQEGQQYYKSRSESTMTASGT